MSTPIQLCTAGECRGECSKCRCAKLEELGQQLQAELDELEAAAAEMQQCQQEYFRIRSRAALIESKAAETRVDAILRQKREPSLFE